MRFRGKLVDIGCIQHFTSKFYFLDDNVNLICLIGFISMNLNARNVLKHVYLLSAEIVNLVSRSLAYCHFVLGVVTTISKLIKACVLRITPTALYFILSEKAVNGGIQIWCELPQVCRLSKIIILEVDIFISV